MNENNILGCFVSSSMDSEWSEAKKQNALEQGRIFRTYIWGDNGLASRLKVLKRYDYGDDLTLILFQFDVNPVLMRKKEIEAYRRKEKSIGISIIVTDENFFSKSEEDRNDFLKKSVLQKLDLLSEVVKKRKLDVKVDQLRSDLQSLVY